MTPNPGFTLQRRISQNGFFVQLQIDLIHSV